MKKIWEKFLLNIRDNSLIGKRDRILVGFSGGPDSVCLLHLLYNLKKINRDIILGACYIDHSLRSKMEVEKDKEFSKKFCKKFGVKYYEDKIKSEIGKSDIEKKARDARLKILYRIAKKGRYNKIALAHNKDDNAETILFNIIRSRGYDGIKDIPVKRKLENSIEIIRPILTLRKKEILLYNKTNKLKYRIDTTNFSMKYTRNYIRHKIIPAIEKINHGFVEHITNLAKWDRIKEDYFSELVERELKRVAKKNNKVVIDLLKFLKYNNYLKYKLIKTTLVNFKGFIEKQNLTDSVDNILNFVLNKDSGIFILNKIKIIKKNNKLVIKYERKNE